ncbi:MAG: hypothetical protein R2712_25800 [Vicinamibacterales bacterium]
MTWRRYATAFVWATMVALVVDAALQLALDAVRVTGFGGGAPWWITANIVARGRWVVLAGLLWVCAPWLADEAHGGPGHAVTRVEAWRRVGVCVALVPMLWVAATWVVTALRFTLLASWATDGRVFLAADYYRGILIDYVPWLLAGIVILAVRRHLD